MKTVHIIPHSHWDREWYMPFEYHRYHLIELIDNCVELFEKDENYTHFHLDGHTLLVEDYLEIKPENKEKIQRCIEEGKFAIGPWYVLQDEFLTSSEANVRNLLVGMDLAKKFGKCCMIGYFPDAFGNAGQMPQILKQAGMKGIVFGRGVKSIGVNNSLLSENQFDSSFSELQWQSPDGSCLPGILFANWYNNGAEIPAEQVEQYWNQKLADVEKYASTEELLIMNGCDHQPVQKNLTEALKAAEEAYPNYHFIQSDFETYVNRVVQELPEKVSVVKGELTSQETDGWCTLTNTASANVELKMMNRKGERLLENVAEPLTVIAQRLGKKVPAEMLLYSWKMLMKNHPHDSICGCSCDEVNDEIRIRFQKSRQAAEMIIADSLEHIDTHIDVSGFKEGAIVFSVINTFGKERTAVVDVLVDVRRLYGADALHQSAVELMEQACRKKYVVVDKDGHVFPCSVTKPEVVFGYDLPKDAFRKPYMAERVCVTFEAEKVPAMGYKSYALCQTENVSEKVGLVTGADTMENEWLRVQICRNGTISIYDKKNDRVFSEVLRYEDVADIGNEYTFVPAPGDLPIYSGVEPVEITLTQDEDYRAEFKISTIMVIPKSAAASFEKEKQYFVDVKNRKSGRSEETTTVAIDTFVALEKHGCGVKVKTIVQNTAKDHRLRVLIPTSMQCSTHKAESVFESVERKNVHHAGWTYPSGCDRQQGFVMMHDEQSGLAVANTGLYEYEILEKQTIAITLLRAVGEIGDWGVFPTEISQCQKKLEFDFEMVPYGCEAEVYDQLAAYQYPMQYVQHRGVQKKGYENGMLQWCGSYLRMTALKPAFGSEDIIMRWVNYSDQNQWLELNQTEWIKQVYWSNVVEEKKAELIPENGVWRIQVKPYEIITLGCWR